MRETLTSLALALAAFVGLGFFLIERMAMAPDMVISTLGLVFALWFVFWLAWAFRWVVVFAPVAICYALFAFYGHDRDIVYNGAVASGVLFVLTALQHWIGNRKRRKIEAEEDQQFAALKKRRDARE